MFRGPSPLEHTWSLAIEEQFYLVWPLVVLGLVAWWKRRTPQAVLVLSIVLSIVTAAIAVALYEPNTTARVYYGTDTRAPAILLGAALAAGFTVFGQARSRAARIAVELLGLAGVVLLAFAWTGLDGGSSTLYRGGLLACGVAAVAVIAAAVNPARGPIALVLGWRPLCLLGLISYGVYLWHWPVDLVVTASRTGVSGWPLFFLQCLVTFSIATASFLLLEMPIRRGAGTPRRWAVAIPAVAGGLVLIVVLGTSGAVSPPSGTAVGRRLAAAVRTTRTLPPTAPRILVVGDSVAWHFGSALQARLTPPRAVVANVSKIGCIFPDGATKIDYRDGVHFTGPDRPRCGDLWPRALAQFRPTTVLFVAWAPGRAVYEYGGEEERSCDTPYRRRYARQLGRLADEVAGTGSHLVVTSYPYSTYDVGSRADRRQVDCVNDTRREVAAAHGATYLDLDRLLCGGRARCEVNGHPLRPDGVHFKGPAMVVVADRVGRELGVA
jgi:hypothetical protein